MYSSFGAVWKNGSRQAKFFTWQTLSLRTAAPAVLAVAPTATAVASAQTTAMVRLMFPPAHVAEIGAAGTPGRRRDGRVAGARPHRTPGATDPSPRPSAARRSRRARFAAIDPRPD